MTTTTKTSEQTGHQRLAMLVSDEGLAFKRRTIEELSADLLKRPVHALRWAEDAFEAAARLAIAEWMQEALLRNAPLDVMHDEADKRMRHFAQYPARSTSPLANLSDDEQRMGWMDILLKIEAAIKHDAARLLRDESPR